MTYVTSKCPHCNAYLGRKTNPVHEVDIPFEKCPHCGGVYLNNYKEEWITKSPMKRFFFYLQIGVWARALIIPLVVFAPLFSILDLVELILPFYLVGAVSWLIAGYFLHRHREKDAIARSIQRTKDQEYVELLKKAKYTIYPIIPAPLDAVRDDGEETRGDVYYNWGEKLLEEGRTEEALQKLEKASELGCDEADISIGYIYLHGNGVEKNVEKAVQYFKKAQAKGNQYAAQILKNMNR